MSTDLELLTSSRLRAYRTCARYHDLRYVQGWAPVREGEALRVGSAVHIGLEAWWQTTVHLDALPAALAAVRGVGIDDYEQVRVEELLVGYDAHWLGERLRYQTISVEEAFRAPLINPTTMTVSRTWMLAGKVDAIALDLETDKVVVVEHKTCSEDVSDAACDYWAKLSMDHQCSAYVLGAEALGHKVDEILYDVIRKPGLRPLRATPPESRKYKKDGTLYANQRDVDETAGEYRERVREEIAERPGRYYQRRQVARSMSQLRDFLFDAWQQSKQMHEAKRMGRAPRNPEACHRFGRCWAWDICANGMRPEEYPETFVHLDDVHPELKEDGRDDTGNKPAEWWEDDAPECAQGSASGT